MKIGTENTEFDISQPTNTSPFVVWGGNFPSGSLKYLTYKYHVEGLRRDIRGFIEMSDASTALALDQLAIERNLSTIAVCGSNGANNLKAHGFHGEIVIPKNLEEAFQVCAQKESEGWHWPRQLTNRHIIGYVERWATDLLIAIKRIPTINTIVSGFGTGASVVGLSSVFSPEGYRVFGLEPSPGDNIHGWRNYDEKNLGENDLFYPYLQTVMLHQVAVRAEVSSCAKVLLDHVYDRGPEEICIVSHDGLPLNDVPALAREEG